MLLVVALCPASADGVAPARPRVILAFVAHLTLGQAAALPGASVALVGPTQSRYRRAQALLDIGQGARTSLAAYDPNSPPSLRRTMATENASRRQVIDVDGRRCQLFGVCTHEAPYVFVIGDNGRLRYSKRVTADQHDAVRQAARTCPMQAIHIKQR